MLEEWNQMSTVRGDRGQREARVAETRIRKRSSFGSTSSKVYMVKKKTEEGREREEGVPRGTPDATRQSRTRWELRERTYSNI
jgi:hypothetical protein